MPDLNPDGTKQVSPPTRSAFAPQKSDPAPAKEATPDPKHVKSLMDGLKGLLGMGGEHEVSEGGKPVSAAVDAAVKGAPGNNADY